VACRNHYVGGEFQLTTSQFGTNLYIGNNSGANGSYAPLVAGHGNAVYERRDAIDLAQQKTGKTLTAGEVSSFWTGEALAYVRQHPLEWLQLMGKKLLLTWNVYEISDTDDQYLAGRWSPLLRFLTAIFHFGVICPIAAIGIVLWQDRRRVWLLYLILAGYSLSVVVFYVFARYRFPLIPILLLFDAAAVVEVYQRYRRSDYGMLVAATVVAVVVGVFANWPTGMRNGLDATALYNLGVAKLKLGQLSEAADYSKQALQFNPDHWGAHNTLGRVLAAQRNPTGAAQEFQIALRQAPQSAELHNNLGNAYVTVGRVADAITEFQEAIRLDSNYADAHAGLGVAFVGLGKWNEAGAAFRWAMELKPDSPDIKRNYNLFLQLQQQRERAR
jgi:Tfp pilus assembly protein PilF